MILGWLRRKRADEGTESGVRTTALLEATPLAVEVAGPLVLFHRRSFDEAEAGAVALLAVDPANEEAWSVRSAIALERRRPADALKLAQAGLAALPGSAVLEVAVGRAQAALGRQQPAKLAYQRALAIDANSAGAHLGLGTIALAARRSDEAYTRFTTALALDPDLAEAHVQTANLLRVRGSLPDAEVHYREAIRVDDRHAEALGNLGAMLKDGGRSDEAAIFLERSVRSDPTLAVALFNLAMIRIDQRRWSDGATLLQRSLAVDPRQADAQYWLGNALMGQGDAVAARAAYRASSKLAPNDALAHWGYTMAQLPAIADSDAAQAAAVRGFAQELGKLETTLRMKSAADGYKAVGALQPFYLAYVPGNHRRVLADYGSLCTSLMVKWAGKVGVPAPSAQSSGKCRVGIVSAHLHNHSVWNAIVRGWVEHLDRNAFELHLFHVGSLRDSESEWAIRQVQAFHHRVGTWEAWAKNVSYSRLDVIVYPEISMDATTARLASLRLARVQVASWGHPLTTGLPTIDAYVSAAAFEPDGAQDHYVERLVTLPGLGCCYKPFGTKPASLDLARWAIASDERLLLCAGSAFKYGPRFDALWVEVAKQCIPCKLVFFETQPASLSALFEQRLRAAFAAAGLAFDDHVRFLPWLDQPSFFALLDRAEVYLDSIEFSGFNTTLQAIERGLPVVAWEGGAMRGHFASGILDELGLPEWIACNEAEYVELARRLCADASLRRTVRATIEARRAALFNDRTSVARFGEHLLAFASGQVV